MAGAARVDARCRSSEPSTKLYSKMQQLRDSGTSLREPRVVDDRFVRQMGWTSCRGQTGLYNMRLASLTF